MPKLIINGIETEVAPGTTVIQAAQKLNIPIAHYCYHEGLSIAGACRMCMVEVEKNPKLQIACNLPVADGMVVRTDTPKVKENVKWILDFHLINHPLDCPICDQAGECKLQDYYMSYGLYNPEMDQRKVKKSKTVSLGDRVVLDQERCILCSRCVRFCNEVTKTSELGIFNRGDRSVLATFENRPMNNNYSVNTVDICPVGALTSKDFRFKQRVWFLKDFESICNGCSTGCNVTVSYNANGVFRVRPKFNKEVNGHWMCDEGRDVYKHTNKEYRLDQVVERRDDLGGKPVKGKPVALALQEIAQMFKGDNAGAAMVVTAQYTNEEYQSVFKLAEKLKIKKFFYWKNNESDFEAFDGLLLRGDRNPNTAGLLTAAKISGVSLSSMKDFNASQFGSVIVLAPENQTVYPDFVEKMKSFAKVKNSVAVTACGHDALADFKWQVPAKAYLEKTGTFINYKGMEQKIRTGVKIIPQAVSLEEFSKGMSEA